MSKKMEVFVWKEKANFLSRSCVGGCCFLPREREWKRTKGSLQFFSFLQKSVYRERGKTSFPSKFASNSIFLCVREKKCKADFLSKINHYAGLRVCSNSIFSLNNFKLFDCGRHHV